MQKCNKTETSTKLRQHIPSKDASTTLVFKEYELFTISEDPIEIYTLETNKSFY